MDIEGAKEIYQTLDNYPLVLTRSLDKAKRWLKEKARGKNDIGTTGKGIGPCYTDKFERSGIRICDLIDEEVFKVKLKEKGFKLAIATTGREHAMEQYKKYNKNIIKKANIEESN